VESSTGATASAIFKDKVGFGTASPNAQIQVVGSTTVSSQVNAAAVIGANVTSELLLGSVNGNAPFVASQGAYPLTFNTNAIERMRVTSSGDVGIGTISPTTYVNSGSGFAVVGTNGQIQAYLGSSVSALTIAGYTNTVYVQSTSNNSLAFGTGGTGSVILRTNGADAATINSSGNIGIGASPNASAILDAQSTTKGVRFPNMTTTQKNAISSPAAGLVVFDTTLAKLCVYSGSAWQTITSV
jgi:hypothetical protein